MARVLIIDDSPILVELVTKALSAAGFDAAGAMDLASLDQQLTARPCDLILVDINMPEMFGDDVVEFLRTQKKTDAQLILYSGMGERELAERAKNSGADGYLTKAAGIEACIADVRARLAKAQAPKTGAPRKRRILI